jgi:hypothetical protein
MDSDLGSRARWAVVALAVYAVFDVIAFFSGLAEYRLLGTDYTIAQATANDDRQALIGMLQFLLLIVTAVIFLRWFKRAYENVERLGGERRYGTGWAVGAWFVPILNLWRPKQIANDIWRASNSEGDADVSSAVQFWWGAWLVASWVGNATLRPSFSADTPDELQVAAAANVTAVVLEFAAALLAIWVVRAITARQGSSAPRLGEAATEGAAF